MTKIKTNCLTAGWRVNPWVKTVPLIICVRRKKKTICGLLCGNEPRLCCVIHCNNQTRPHTLSCCSKRLEIPPCDGDALHLSLLVILAKDQHKIRSCHYGGGGPINCDVFSLDNADKVFKNSVDAILFQNVWRLSGTSLGNKIVWEQF